MEEILKDFNGKFTQYIPVLVQNDIETWLKEKLTAIIKDKDKTIAELYERLQGVEDWKQEFLKMIFPEFERSEDGKYDDGFNDCREEIIINASKEGVTIK
jgi:hypothetical protein